MKILITALGAANRRAFCDLSRISATQLNVSYRHLHNGPTDPDYRVRLQLGRDCAWESDSD